MSGELYYIDKANTGYSIKHDNLNTIKPSQFNCCIIRTGTKIFLSSVVALDRLV